METIFDTERLIVRRWKDSDLQDLSEILFDSEVIKFLPCNSYYNLDQVKERLSFLIRNYEGDNAQVGNFAIVLKNSNKVIGDLGINYKSKKAGGILSIGWSLNKKFQGFGYMTEAVKEMFRYIKKNKIAMRIYATHDVDNIKSGNVMRRVGMTFEGISRKAGENNFHSRYDVANYSILFEEIE